MNKPIRPGQLQVISRGQQHKRVIAAFILGFAAGAATEYVAQAQPPQFVPAALVDTGRWLCGAWGGLADIMRVDKDRYTFRCQQYAVFDRLEVTYEQR